MSIIGWVYQDSWSSVPSALKVNNKFEVLLVKILSLKQKQNQELLAITENIKFLLLKKTYYDFFR